MIPTKGMMILSTSDLTILPKAAPMITPIARSITFPLKANALNSSSSENARREGSSCRKSMRPWLRHQGSNRQPRRQNTAGGQLDDAQAENVWVGPKGLKRLGGGNAVQVHDADGLTPLLLAADVHLGDVDALITQGLADEAD